ncbi:MAG: fasciclin domain-containing protein [Aquabacterium sp.]|uniref:fasciclin domain-containing protein n=1 Tax=Aquabacterium sp. TaxID=1872578 RepID=UPI003BE81D0E
MKLIPRHHLILAAVLATALNITGCANTQVANGPVTLSATIAAEQELSTFNKLAQDSGLAAQLGANGPVTIFAPSDAAFKALPAETLSKLSKDPEALKNLLNFHIVQGVIKSTDITGSSTKETLQGAKISISKAGDFVTVEDAMVTSADKVATNGVIHVIDTVLTPPKKK